MAEGGSESLKNNLCRNLKEKVVDEKTIQQRLGFPDTRISELDSHGSVPHGLVNGPVPSTVPPIHCHSNLSETDLKDPLDKAPLLTPTVSKSNVNEKMDQPSGSNSDTKINNVNPAPLTADNKAKEQSEPPGACKLEPMEEPRSRSEGESSIASSYVRATLISHDTASTLSDPNFSAASQEEPKAQTNDLSAPNPGPTQPSTFPFYPPMMGPGFGSMAGGMMPMWYYYYPMSFNPPPQLPMFTSYPFCPMSQSMPPNAQSMMHNISCVPQGMYGVNGATGGNGVSGENGVSGGNGVRGGSPLGSRFGSYGSQEMMDSRNIPVNNTGSSAPSSEENNCKGSQPYSINPGQNTRLTKLRDPVLKWIRKKLDQSCLKNWEAVADARGWNYEDIRDHLDECKRSCGSPFLKLLESETFCTYTVQDFLHDMERIGRRDILMDFDEVLQKN